MLSSFTKSIKRNKTSYSNLVDSSSKTNHDSTVRHVHIIQENKAISEKNGKVKYDDVHYEKDTSPLPFDELSLSTHSSLDEVPVQTVFICNEEGKVLSGNDDFGDEDYVQAMDQGTGNPKENQGKSSSKYRNAADDLSFHADGSVFDGSGLDGVLDNFKAEEESNRSKAPLGTFVDVRKTTPLKPGDIDWLIPKIQEEEDDENFNKQAFSEIGRIMFKQQPDTHASKESSIRSHPTFASDSSEVKKILFQKKKRFSLISRITMWFKTILALFAIYGITTLWFSFTSHDDIVVQEKGKAESLFSEESFHHAMYHLSLATDADSSNESTFLPDSTLPLLWTSMRYCYYSALLAAFLYKISAHVISKTGVKIEVKTTVPGKGRMHNNNKTPRKSPKLKRELHSLDKHKIFASTFLAEIVSPDGSINSVKRSSRAKSNGQSIRTSEVAEVKVDLFRSFDAEPKVEEGKDIKMKVKTEKF